MFKLAQTRHNSSKQKGQALLIILLVMAVILTIALSIASRSVTDISVSKQEDDASRAFSAAEAGVEQALNNGTLNLNGSSLTSGGTFNASVTKLADAQKQYVLPSLAASGEAVTVWFVNHDANNNLVCNAGQSLPCSTTGDFDICWGESGTSQSQVTTPAIELSIIYTTSGSDWSTAKIARAAYDPYVGRPGSPSNSFSPGIDSAQVNVAGTTLAFCKRVTLSSLNVTARSGVSDSTGAQFARIKLFYNTDKAHPVAINIRDSGTLPPQGNDVNSLGQSGDAARKIEVKQQFRDLPPIFDFGLYSGSGGITQ